MTTCSGGPAEAKTAQYLAGELSELDSEEFENHFMGCHACHDMVLAVQEIKVVLAEVPPVSAVRGAPLPGNRARVLSFPGRISLRWVALGSIAALLLLVALVAVGRKHRDTGPTSASAVPGPVTVESPERTLQSSSQPNSQSGSQTTSRSSPAAAQLAQLEAIADLGLPQYQAPQLRGADPAESDSHSVFIAGMQSYTAGDCATALDRLNRVGTKSPDAVAAALYSGLCQLQLRQLQQAGRSLTKVIASGDTPQLEMAEFYRAQAALLSGDAVGAERWLGRTIALRGDYEQRARLQRARLRTDLGGTAAKP